MITATKRAKAHDRQQPAMQPPTTEAVPFAEASAPDAGPHFHAGDRLTLLFWFGCALILAVLHALDLRSALFRLLGLSGG